MITSASPRGRILLLLLFIGSHLPMVGCNDDSKTSGTMVQESEEARAYRKERGATYKGGSPANKARFKAAAAKKKE